MNDKIIQKLAMQVAQLNYDKTVLEVQVEELQAQLNAKGEEVANDSEL
ncbi:hypothetical protein [Streptococcus parauberis]|uniref:Uncharacterized protein n=1 Tax=Streptococcus parauberis NCFD 2020 TaxID=873447 RepID=F1Z0M9_9STRE|nr:hypothetical protein [Streptococcus parauberis]EGE53039.1 hypothetical protein SPB_0673 [Streptococcus parauberis NCFD 2020]QBX18342.1 hypothetical protein Javan411_0046 [Streptococcus phage Javan411]QBX27603.1 hypothetical protein Javan400_0005 [Streptococcus phage Javan400]